MKDRSYPTRGIILVVAALAIESVLCINVSICQTIPQGPLLWLRADSGVQLENGFVSGWSDASGNQYDASQTDTPYRPSLITNGLAGLPAVHFNGLSFLNAPSIFPCNQDYSVSGVIRLSDTTAINNVFSGSGHAIWFNSSCYLHFHQTGFQVDAIASVPVNPNGSSFTVIYNADLSTVRIYIDGRMSDSLWTMTNGDASILIGAFEDSYFLHGDISELILYDRQLDSAEESETDHYLETKYGLTERPTPPPVDTTFTIIPEHAQFFPRNSQDSATITIAGTLLAPGFDSMYVETLQNGVPIRRSSIPLQYAAGGARFSIQTSIHAELSEYAVQVGARRNGEDSILIIRDSLVCGDAFLVSGQSNAFIGFQVQPTLNEFCRTFGVDFDHNARDTQWTVAPSLYPGFYNNICAWSFALAQVMIDSLHIPVCVIDGASPGCTIEDQLPDDTDRMDMNTAYGLALYRTVKAGLLNSIHAIVWDQGEWNTDTNYYQNFVKLRASWFEDYPALQKVYVVQIRPNECGLFSDQRPLKELQRHFEDFLPNVVCFASAALPLHDGCHLRDSGYRVWGMQLYRLFARDFYHAADTVAIASPNVRAAFYTTPAHDEIEVLFSPADASIVVTPDTVIYGTLRRMIDFFYLDDVSGSVQSIRTQGNALFLSVNNPSAQTLTYLPDRFYPDSSGVYEGPWIVNGRGVAAFIWYRLPISDKPLSVKAKTDPAPNIVVVPDPASGNISIDAEELTGPIEATLVSETGDIVWQKSLPGDHSDLLTFDLTNESSGCYLLRLSNGRTSIERKFILEH